ncbi:MAG: T9SS type A sorting domain-containing protein [Melioribacteraceae bacterium]|nr:T9SS type A sorting domain-containing protein [Melioribacteraceae bacterium]
MKSILLLICLISTAHINAQIDTTDWYPMQVGNKWEYYDPGYGYSTVEIIKDTLMPNGKVYKDFSGIYFSNFQRESSGIIFLYDRRVDKDVVLYDFISPEKTILTNSSVFTGALGIYEIGKDTDNLFGLLLEWRDIMETYIDTTKIPYDTTWGAVDVPYLRITKGIRVSSYNQPFQSLTGAIINGVAYGTLVGIEEEPDLLSEYKLYQNYPNPFNPSTKIEYTLAKAGNVSIKVYDSLGREVKTLFEGWKNKGSYQTMFTANNLPSGTYFIQLACGTYHETIKALLLK